MLGKSISALYLVLICHPALASDALTQTMLEFGNPRTALFALLAEQPEGGGGLAAQFAHRLGLNGSGPSRISIAYKHFSVEPILRYDNNTNGGMTANSVLIFGVPFVVAEESRAVEDVTVGAALSSGIGAVIAPGTVLSFDSRLSYRRGVEHGFNIREKSGAFSLSHNFRNWNYLGAFYAYSAKDVEMLNDRVKIIGLTVGKVFGDSSRINDISGTISRVRDGSYLQHRLRLSWEGGITTGKVLKTGIEFGEAVENAHLPRYAVTLGYSGKLWNNPVSINVAQVYEAGSDFLGSVRKDRISIVNASYKLNPKITVYGSIERRSSTVRELINTSYNVWFSLPSFRF